MDPYLIGVVSNIGLIAFLALSAYLVLLIGEISFGQQAMFGIGAYGAGIATALWNWPLGGALAFGAAVAALAALLIAWPTVRLHGLYFAVATLAFAEMVRLGLELFVYQIEIGGELAGPNGSEGFREIRYIFANDIAPEQFMLLVYGVLGAVVAALTVIDRSRLGAMVRMVGEDDLLAELQGIAVVTVRLAVITAAGALAGLGGGLFAHFTTYVEPRNFDIMLGVHSLAYGLIGGLGTAIGPLLGAAIDIGLLQAIRPLAGYRMILFGGLVAVLLIVRPRGLLDEAAVHGLGRFGRRVADAAHQRLAGPLRRH